MTPHPAARYSVYVIRLTTEAGRQARFKQRNPDRRADKPCVYVGSTAKTPQARYQQHLDSPWGSVWVKRYGTGLHQRLTDRQPTHATRAEAELAEYTLAMRLRARGYGVWTNLPHVPPFYKETRFRSAPGVHWPTRFAIVTAYATTGETWTAQQNRRADRRLWKRLTEAGLWRSRLTGYSPSSGHEEPGWAVTLPFEDACDLGKAFKQDAIYWVEEGRLYLSYCDARRTPIPLGVAFAERCDVEEHTTQPRVRSDPRRHRPVTLQDLSPEGQRQHLNPLSWEESMKLMGKVYGEAEDSPELSCAEPEQVVYWKLQVTKRGHEMPTIRRKPHPGEPLFGAAEAATLAAIIRRGMGHSTPHSASSQNAALNTQSKPIPTQNVDSLKPL